MSRQHPRPQLTGNRILILILVSEISDHCQNLLDDPRMFKDMIFLSYFSFINALNNFDHLAIETSSRLL